MPTVYDLLPQLVDDCLSHQRRMDPQPGVPHEVYVREHCTVHLGTYRRAGHTTAALQLLRKLPCTLYLMPIQRAADRTSQRAESMGIDISRCRFLGIEHPELLDLVRGMSLDAVILDGVSASLIGRAYHRTILECFLHSETRLFVIVG